MSMAASGEPVDRLRICVSGLRGFPDVMGGIETHCQSLYPRLAAGPDRFDVVAFGRSPYVGRKAYDYKGVRVRPVWTLRNKLLETIVHTTLSVWVARMRERGDVLHLHAIGPALLTPAARLLGLRVVVTHHGHDYDRLKWGGAARLALRMGEFLMARFAHQVICVGRSSAARLRDRFPDRRDRIHFVPNGASIPEPGADDAGVLAELGLTPGRYILAVGRLVPEKGFQDLIAAHRRARTDMPLVIVGGADHDDSFSAGLRAAASERIRFAGVRRHGALAVLYRDAGLFVLPSYHEGHPIVALEALRSGAPVLLSDIEPNRDIGLPDRHYVPVGDVVALAEALSHDDFAALRSQDPGLLEAYDWDRIATATAAILRQAAA